MIDEATMAMSDKQPSMLTIVPGLFKVRKGRL